MDIEIRDYEDKDYMEFCGMVNSLYSEDTEGQPMNISKVAATMNEYGGIF